MGCGASSDTSRVQAPTLNKKSVLPAIEPQKKSYSAKSNGSSDSGIEDSEPIKPTSNVSKIPVPIENFFVEHHQKSRLGHGETFDIITAPKPGRLAPLRHVPRLATANKPTTISVDPDLQAKIAAKQERASRKRQEIEEARRLAASRIGHRGTRAEPVQSSESYPNTATRDERHQQLSMLRDKLRQSGSNHSLADAPHTPRTPRPDSVTSGMTDIANMTPRRGAFATGATAASNFKAVYD